MPQIDLGPVIGPQGPKGDTGPQGEQGPQGPQGPAGKFDMDAGLTFSEASARANINSGESLKTILGKIKKYFTDLKPHAFKAPANNFTTTDATTAAAAPTVKQLKEDYDKLNSAFAKSNMDVIWVNQEGTYTFPLPIGKMAVVITYHGIYPHYSSSSGISANQLGGDTENENVITSVNNAQRTVSVYNKGDGATQAVIFMPRQ